MLMYRTEATSNGDALSIINGLGVLQLLFCLCTVFIRLRTHFPLAQKRLKDTFRQWAQNQSPANRATQGTESAHSTWNDITIERESKTQLAYKSFKRSRQCCTCGSTSRRLSRCQSKMSHWLRKLQRWCKRNNDYCKALEPMGALAMSLLLLYVLLDAILGQAAHIIVSGL